MDKISFGRKITEKREGLGESQADFGRRFGVSQQAVFSWEVGLTIPGRSNLEALCSLIGVPMKEAMLMRNPPTIQPPQPQNQPKPTPDQELNLYKNRVIELTEMNDLLRMLVLARDKEIATLEEKLAAALQTQAPKKKVM